VAILVEAATDNRNRTAADVRAMFAKNGGQLAGAGAVAWQFEPHGVVAVARDGTDPDEIALAAIDAGADDVDTEGDPIEVLTAPAHVEELRRALEASGVTIESAEVTMHPTTPIDVDAHVARQNLRLIEALEDLDDVQRVTASFNLPSEVLAEAASA
jgi:YebC/PmpR family DNA-binding regulatory protein